MAVLIPHYNNLEGLRRSLTSIAADDPGDVVVVDDGSAQPPTEDFVRAAVAGTRHVRVLSLPSNAGIEAALNAGLDHIVAGGYEYIARLDCGDRNVGSRFATQLGYLQSRPEVLLLGGAARFVDTDGVTLFVRQMPAEHREIAAFMWKNNAFMHPSVMFRASVVGTVGHYPTGFPAAEDYAYFWAIMDAGRVANLPEVLIEYEVDPGSISRSKRDRQLRSRLQVQRLHADGSMASRLGIMRTRALLAMPVEAIDRLKARMYGQP
jgi:GT2 family glycosyltransferase